MSYKTFRCVVKTHGALPSVEGMWTRPRARVIFAEVAHHGPQHIGSLVAPEPQILRFDLVNTGEHGCRDRICLTLAILYSASLAPDNPTFMLSNYLRAHQLPNPGGAFP